MTKRELLDALEPFDMDADVQIFLQEDDETGYAYRDIKKVASFTNIPDVVIEVGEVRATG